MENGPPKWLLDGWTLFRGFGGLSLANWGEIGQKLKRPISLFDLMHRKGVLTHWCWYAFLHKTTDDSNRLQLLSGRNKTYLDCFSKKYVLQVQSSRLSAGFFEGTPFTKIEYIRRVILKHLGCPRKGQKWVWTFTKILWVFLWWYSRLPTGGLAFDTPSWMWHSSFCVPKEQML